MRLALFFMGCLFVAKSVFACSPAESNTLAAFEQEITAALKEHANASVIDFGFLPSQCKSWSQKVGSAILAKPYLYESAENGERYFGMVVAVVDEQTGKILSSINDEKMMVVDAIEPSDINIDTADYAIRPGGLAFGIRTTRRNYSDAAPIRQESMNVYIIDRGSLGRVVDSLLMNSSHGEGNPDCEFSGVENTAILSVLKNTTKGYYDLRERIKTNHIKYIKNGSECKKTSAPTTATDYILKFNGATYGIPKALQADVE
ncbi:hypothetical protein [Paraburkholderia tagetis]|uniref:Uncharacterized protein n=1 Tax=Paraburkholderia tagetis TaxID=2913261 RepID=A0A9X1ULE7_9BURK|nr:hypothetical protein [Paraburkholderia tagetis]MCG5077531.1 hypothetical protein [Paraburkholderia tagetis]